MDRRYGANQQKILDYIKEQIQLKGYPPSVREIGNAVGLKSTSTVHGHLQRLEKRGLIRRNPMKPRTLQVVDHMDTEQGNSVMVPLVGDVTAGIPILAEENRKEYIAIPDIMLMEGEHFILLVHGESMIDAGILDGDYIVVHKQPDANNGDIVVAMIEDDATVKRYYKENGHFRLQPQNSSMQPIIVNEVTILGKVVSLYRMVK